MDKHDEREDIIVDDFLEVNYDIFNDEIIKPDEEDELNGTDNETDRSQRDLLHRGPVPDPVSIGPSTEDTKIIPL